MRSIVFFGLFFAVCVWGELLKDEKSEFKRNIYLHSNVIDTSSTPAFSERSLRSLEPETLQQFLVHLRGPITDKIKAEVQDHLGTKLGAYFPHNSFLVVTTKEKIANAHKVPHILWTGPFLPEYKMSKTLAQLPLPNFEPNKLRIRIEHFYTDSTNQVVEKWRTQFSLQNLQVSFLITDQTEVVATTSDIKAVAEWLAKQPECHWIEPVSTFSAHNKWSTKIVQSGSSTNAPFSKTLTGKNQVVAIGDTGIADTCFFRTGQVTRDCSFVGTGTCTDAQGHGTAVAATIAGSPTDPATAPYSGQAPGASLHAIHLGYEAQAGVEGVTITRPSSWNTYFQAAYDANARILVSAFGGSDVSYTSDSQSVDTFAAAKPDLLLIFPAGNSGTSGTFSINSPANAKNALTVGSTINAFDAVFSLKDLSPLQNSTLWTFKSIADQLKFPAPLVSEAVASSFSSRGPTSDLRIKPDIMAPGEAIFSAQKAGCSATDAFSGTSFAAGAAAGAAALVREYLTSGFYPDGVASESNQITPTAAQLKAILINSGQAMLGVDAEGPLATISNFVYFNRIPDVHQGFGRMNLANTLYVSGTGSKFFLANGTDAVDTGATLVYCFSLPAQGKAKATLVWTDPAASPATTVALVNNLDLVIVDRSNGRQYRANNLVTFDNLNNVEQVQLVNSKSSTGQFAAYVYGANVPAGPQKFALVISGAVWPVSTTCADAATAVCPSSCSGNGKCENGVCTCNPGSLGVDCSLSVCPNNCNGASNSTTMKVGICLLETATCLCNSKYTGPDCGTLIVAPVRQQENTGIPTAALIGAVIGGILMGLLVGGVIGWFIAVKYLENQRKKKREQLMRGQGDM